MPTPNQVPHGQKYNILCYNLQAASYFLWPLANFSSLNPLTSSILTTYNLLDKYLESAIIGLICRHGFSMPQCLCVPVHPVKSRGDWPARHTLPRRIPGPHPHSRAPLWGAAPAQQPTSLRNLHVLRVGACPACPDPVGDPVGELSRSFSFALQLSTFNLAVRLSPLAATLMDRPAGAANKRLTA